jgi:urease accessory protein
MVLAISAVSLTSSTALAHPQDAVLHGGGFLAGFAHPWLGLDHLLAMIAVGLLAAQMGGRARWLLPAAFLSAMAWGGMVGLRFAALGSLEWVRLEWAIGLSVVLLGASVASGRRYPLLLAACAMGTFGLFHGHAHGTEIPVAAAPALYAAGFLVATAVLHLAGLVAAHHLLANDRAASVVRLAGGAIAGAGMLMLAGAL